jgi:hypothetical protein
MGLKVKFISCMACYFRLLDTLDSALQERLLDGHRKLNVPASHQLIFEADLKSAALLDKAMKWSFR